MLAFLFLLVVNLLISYWDAYAVGKAWVETKHNGGWPRLMAWMGAIMSACGFSWCYLCILVVLAAISGTLTFQDVEAAISLGYLIVIPGILFSGLMITLDSWARAYRERTAANIGAALYNTYAQIHNYYHAIDGVGDALGNVVGFLLHEEGDTRELPSSGKVWVLLLVLFALSAGMLTTAVIINLEAGKDELGSANRLARVGRRQRRQVRG